MMTDNWEEFFFSEEELKELHFSSERLVYNFENGIAIHMGFSNDFCISLCKRWEAANRNGDIVSVALLHSFFESFINNIEEHLEEEGIDWRAEPDV
jgi:hypothetical protein